MGDFGAGSLLAVFHSGFACLLSSDFTNFSVSRYIILKDFRDQTMTSVMLEQSPRNSVLNADLTHNKCKITRGNCENMFMLGRGTWIRHHVSTSRNEHLPRFYWLE